MRKKKKKERERGSDRVGPFSLVFICKKDMHVYVMLCLLFSYSSFVMTSSLLLLLKAAGKKGSMYCVRMYLWKREGFYLAVSS